jgi:hypothetical protein
MDPIWISIVVAVVTAILAVPTFIREITSVFRANPAGSAQGLRRVPVIIGILVLLSWAAVAFDVYARRQGFSAYAQLTKITGQTYSHETVQLDGFYYINCTFNEVTFKFDGIAPTQFTNIIISGGSNFISASPVVQEASFILATLAQAAGHPVKVTPR